MPLLITEPPAVYRQNPPAVVDAGILAAFIFLEPEATETEARISRYTLFAPNILPLEIANVAMNKLRRGIADAHELGERLSAFNFNCLQLRETPPDGVFALAADYRLSAYDAACLWLAGDLRAPLLTYDIRLAEAARDFLARLR